MMGCRSTAMTLVRRRRRRRGVMVVFLLLILMLCSSGTPSGSNRVPIIIQPAVVSWGPWRRRRHHHHHPHPHPHPTVLITPIGIRSRIQSRARIIIINNKRVSIFNAFMSNDHLPKPYRTYRTPVIDCWVVVLLLLRLLLLLSSKSSSNNSSGMCMEITIKQQKNRIYESSNRKWLPNWVLKMQ